MAKINPEKEKRKLDRARNEYLKIAKDCLYPPNVIEAIKNAENEIQMEQIVISARRNK